MRLREATLRKLAAGLALVGLGVTRGVTAPSIVILDPNGTRLLVVTSPHAAGPVDVVVRNPDGRSGALPGGYRYVAPARVSRPRIPRTVTRP